MLSLVLGVVFLSGNMLAGPIDVVVGVTFVLCHAPPTLTLAHSKLVNDPGCLSRVPVHM